MGTIIYRLKASDSDNNFPLAFEVLGSVGKSLLGIEFLGCSIAESLCQADVLLNKGLVEGRTYEFKLRVRDTTGDYTQVPAVITATSASFAAHSVIGTKILHVPEVPIIIVFMLFFPRCKHIVMILRAKKGRWGCRYGKWLLPFGGCSSSKC